MVWELLGSTKLGSAGDIITVDNLTVKNYLMVQYFIIPSGSLDNISARFNNDSGSNYARRYSTDGGSDGVSTSLNQLRFRSGGAVSNTFFGEFPITNISDEEKLVISHQVRNNANGAGTAPSRAEMVGKWANTSTQITRIDLIQDGSGSFDTDSEVTVYGTS